MSGLEKETSSITVADHLAALRQFHYRQMRLVESFLATASEELLNSKYSTTRTDVPQWNITVDEPNKG